MTQSALERQWRSRAAALARRLNLGWWLERFNSLLLGGLLVFAVFLLGGRTWRSEWVSHETTALALGGLVVLLAAAAWILSRRRFVDAEVGLVRLDDRLGLNNRLVSAASRIGEWPESLPDGTGKADFAWNPSRAWVPGLAALALVAAAWWLPLPASSSRPERVVEPGAWQQMEDWLETLREEEWIEEHSIEEYESRIAELRDQPEADWFRHSSLEATDTLQQTLGTEIRDLAEEMDRLERNLSALQTFSSQMSPEAREQMRKEMGEALEAIEGSGLGVDERLLRQLREIDPSKLGGQTLGGLSAEQLKALQEQLRKGSGALGSMEGLPRLGPGEGPGLAGSGFGEKGEMPGRGGLQRGRGDAPLFFGDREDDLGTDNLEQVANDDLSRASLGEVLGTGETEREIDQTATGPVDGGKVGSTGRGGEAISRESLLPDEQAVLKRYFK